MVHFDLEKTISSTIIVIFDMISRIIFILICSIYYFVHLNLKKKFGAKFFNNLGQILNFKTPFKVKTFFSFLK